jgi:hypothetical protein
VVEVVRAIRGGTVDTGAMRRKQDPEWIMRRYFVTLSVATWV